ncbi:hypothetical protein A6R68_03156, partial [Neotoma lepida]
QAVWKLYTSHLISGTLVHRNVYLTPKLKVLKLTFYVSVLCMNKLNQITRTLITRNVHTGAVSTIVPAPTGEEKAHPCLVDGSLLSIAL